MILEIKFLYQSISIDIGTIISIISGAVISYLIGRFFYKKAGDEMLKEAKELKKQTQLVLTAMEQAGLVDLMRDNGNIIGFSSWNFRPKGFDSFSSGNPTIGPKKPEPATNAE